MEGCTLSNIVSTYTLEAPPQGVISTEVRRPVTEPRAVSVRWLAVSEPNGVINYTVYANGLFYRNAGNCRYRSF